MLSELKLKNFISYDSESVKLPANATIAVVGENGHGKSSMLEAIPFALFGEGRTELGGMARQGSEGGMFATVLLKDVPNPGSRMKVERGLRKSGSGYTKVWIDDVLAEQGGAKPTNNKAQDLIDQILGVDRETFFLTSFFGLGRNDTLMQVRPSERLETMQSLAGVDICQKFNSVAKKHQKEWDEKVSDSRKTLEVLEELMEDPKELQEDLDLKREERDVVDDKLADAFAKRTGLLRDEDRYQGLNDEKSRVGTKVGTSTQSVELLEKKIRKRKKNLRQMKLDNKEMIDSKRKLEADLKRIRPESELIEDIGKADNEIGALTASAQLRREAVDMHNEDGDSTCPLCAHAIDHDAVNTWDIEADEMDEKISFLDQKRADLVDTMNLQGTKSKKLNRLKAELESDHKAFTVEQKEIASLENELAQEKAVLEKNEARFLKLKEELVGYEAVIEQMQELDGEISDLQTQKGSKEESIKSIRDRIEKYRDSVKKKKVVKRTMKEAEKKSRGYALVAEGFSRYAIPVELLRNLRTALEQKATRIFHEFSEGQIKVIDIEGARPGIDFVLEDEMGQKPYRVLSSGEKVMVFLSIRCALTQIINATKDNKVDFLILDEIAGNLSPNRREALTKLINKLLRTFFPQVFMVSHVELRDIFNTTLHVVKEEGVSHVETTR